MSDSRRNSEDATRSLCPSSSRAAQRAAAIMHRRSESASTVMTSSTITPSTVTRRRPLSSVTPDTSFDSDVSSSADTSRHYRRDVSPEASSSTSARRSASSSSSSPRLPYTPDRSISSVLESSRRWDSPQTPQTPGAASSSVPSTTSPVSRAKPRFKHSSSDTPLRKAEPVQALPFPLTSIHDKYQQQQGQVPRVRFSDAHPRSMPKLSATTFSPPTPARANTSPSLLPAESRSRSDSADRRRSAQVSSTAAAAPNSGSWQRRVAEEMIRLSLGPANASNTSLSSKRNSRHSTGTRSSGEFQQAHLDPRLATLNQPTKAPTVPFPAAASKPKPKTRPGRSNTTPSPKKPSIEYVGARDKENREHKLAALIRHTEPVEVRVVKQESFDHPDALGINAQQWRLDVDLPTPSLGIPLAAGSSDEKGKANEGDVDESEEPVLRPRPRQTRRSVRSRNSSGARSLAATGNANTPDIAEAVQVPAQDRITALRQTSQNNLQSNRQRRGTGSSNYSHPSSPDDSPAPSRHRLSSYAIEPSSLFFAPRATPPPSDIMQDEDDERKRPAPKQSSGSVDQLSAVPSSSRPTSSYVTAPQSTISTPRPPELQIKEDDGGKGKGKRSYEEVEPVPPQPQASGSGNGGTLLGNGLVIPPRQRLESNMTRYTDDDTIGELPENPRKRMKMASSAHIVQTLTEAVAAQSSPDSSYEQPQHSQSTSEHVPRGILNKSPAPASTTEAEQSRPDSRRSQSVSFTLQAGSTRDGARSPSVASTRGRRPLSVGSRPLSPSQTSTKSIPLMAIISPRPASFVTAPPSSSARNGSHQHYHLREPRRYSNASRPMSMHAQSPTSPQSMAHMQSLASPIDEESSVRPVFVEPRSRGLPFQGWAFFVGFLVPFAWWVAAFSRVDYDAYARDAEAGVESRFPPMEIITWRRRCRLMSVFSIIVYIPVIVLAVIFGR